MYGKALQQLGGAPMPPQPGSNLGAPPSMPGAQAHADESAGTEEYDVAKDPIWAALPVTHEADHRDFLNSLKPEQRAMILRMLLSSMLGGKGKSGPPKPTAPPAPNPIAAQVPVGAAPPPAV